MPIVDLASFPWKLIFWKWPNIWKDQLDGLRMSMVCLSDKVSSSKSCLLNITGNCYQSEKHLPHILSVMKQSTCSSSSRKCSVSPWHSVDNDFCSYYAPTSMGPEVGQYFFGADPVSVYIGVPFCLHSISWMNGWILTKLHWLLLGGGKE